MGRWLPEKVRAERDKKIIELRNEGRSYGNIARYFGISKGIIWYTLQKAK